MPTLPDELDPERLMGLQLPGDITLGEARNYITTHSTFRDLYKDDNHFKKSRLRFMRIKPKRIELPDNMLISEFQSLVSKGDAIIEIDDEGGGTPVKAPVKTLV